MEKLKKEMNNALLILVGCIVFSIFAPIVMKNAYVIILGAIGIALFGYRYFMFSKLLKNDEYVVIDAVCTDVKKRNPLNYGISRTCEFEPVDKSIYSEIFNVEIPDDSLMLNFSSKKNAKSKKIYVGYTYSLVFKKKKDDKTADFGKFLCYGRKSLKAIENDDSENVALVEKEKLEQK